MSFVALLIKMKLLPEVGNQTGGHEEKRRLELRDPVGESTVPAKKTPKSEFEFEYCHRGPERT